MGIFDKSKKQEQIQNSLKSEESKSDITQKQIAGEESTQFQVGTVIVNQGITEERARSIFTEMIPQALDEYTKDAYTTANSRIQKLEKIVIPRVTEIKGAINAFSDPAFQILLRKAQQAAAATKREDNYSLLSELLICHIQKGEDLKNRTGITKAIEIVDYIDNDALCGLTLVHAIDTYRPITGNIREGLEALNNLYSRLLYTELPKGMDWIDHLDILGTIRINSLSHFKRFIEYFPQELPGYACIGIKKDSEGYIKACDILHSIKLEPQTLISHELLDGFVRLPLRNNQDIDNLNIINGGISRKITEHEKTAFNEIWSMYESDASLQKSVNNEFMRIWDSFDVLKKVRLWWESMSVSFNITKIGTVLAHTNAKRCDTTLPDLL